MVRGSHHLPFYPLLPADLFPLSCVVLSLLVSGRELSAVWCIDSHKTIYFGLFPSVWLQRRTAQYKSPYVVAVSVYVKLPLFATVMKFAEELVGFCPLSFLSFSR